MVKHHFTIALGLAACAALTGAAWAGDEVHGWYGGLGVGISHLSPDTDGTTFRVDESQSSGGKVFLGYDLDDRWAVEGYYSDLGKATLNPVGSIKYRDLGVSGMYHLHRSQPQGRGWSAFVRAGLGSMSNDADVPYSRSNDTHLMVGAGVVVPLGTAWAIRFDLDLYDRDSQLATVGLVWNFGRSAPAPAPAAQPATEIAAAEAVPIAAEPAAEPLPPPPADGDGDGIADEADRCPDSAVGAKVDEHGCNLRPTIVLEGVNFTSASAELSDESRAALDKTATSLRRYPGLRIEVAGYTDSSGQRAANIALSQRRAESVRDYLIAQGIAPEQLTAQGLGPDQPLADNATAAGRAANRRVELHIQDADMATDAGKM